jgi:NADH-ubiquinone oxidoreductase chain 4
MTVLFQYPLECILAVLTIGFFVCFILPTGEIELARLWALSSSVVAFIVALFGCAHFDQTLHGFQFVWRLNLYAFNNATLALGVDGLSLVFLLLTLFIFPVCILAAWNITLQTKRFFIFLLGIEILLVLTFTTLDLLYFYIFFESLLIPIFIIIGVWGSRERKIKAGYYFFLYTLFGSLFMLFGILYLFVITGSTSFHVLLNTVLEPEQQRIIWFCFFIAFAVKIPLYPFHIW